jgi:hypothetical protein
MIPLTTHPIKLSFAIPKEQENYRRTHFLLLLSEYTSPPFPLLSNMGKAFKLPHREKKDSQRGKGGYHLWYA